LSKGLLKGIYIPNREQLNLRQVLRTREQIKIKRARAINQIKGLLMLHGIHLDSRGISKQAAALILEMDLPSMVKMSIKLHLEEIDLINQQLKELEKEYLKIKDHEQFGKNFQIIQSVPGVGPLIAASLTYEIGDWRRFNNEKQVAAFFGLTPAEYSSGESVHRGRITGQGNPILRTYLIQASWYLIDKDEKMKAFFERISKHSGSKKKAIVAVARKLICRIFSMVKNERTYKVCAAA
jgi:transposase